MGRAVGPALWLLAVLALLGVHAGRARGVAPVGWGPLLAWAGVSVAAAHVVLVLGLLGWLGPAGLVLGLVLGLLVPARVWGPAPVAGRRAVVDPARWLAVGLCVAMAASLVLRPQPFATDDLSYHASAVAHWVRSGGIAEGPAGYQETFPMGAELVASVVPAVMGGPTWLHLGGLWALLGLVLAVERVSERLGGRGASWAALWVAALPVVRGQGLTAVGADLLGPAAALGGAALFFGPGPAWLVGGLLGLALSAKPLMIPAVAALLLVGGLERTTRRRALEAGLWALPLGGFFYARALWRTGSPFFPMQLGPFGGADLPTRTSLVGLWLRGELDLGAALWGHLDQPLGFGLLALGGGLWLGWRAWREREPVVIAFAVIWWVTMLATPFAPFTGRSQVGAPQWVALRFWVLPAALGLVAGGRWLSGWAGLLLGVSLLWGAWVALGGMLVGAGLAWVVSRGLPSWKGGLAVGLALLLLTPWREAELAAGLAQSGVVAPAGREGALAGLPAGTRVAWFQPWGFQYYELFGADWRLEPVRVHPDGRRYVHVWQRFAASPEGFRWDEPPPVSPEALLRNLLASRVDVVLVSDWRGAPGLPAQARALDSVGATLLAKGEHWRLYRVSAAPN